MRYGSICSGIEAATVAWHGLGWEPAFFSEIDNFPRAALQHHYPNVPLHGDFTTINGDEYGHVDLLVGGTPCQDFSVAGLRAGLAGERGNLTLEFARLVDRMRPQWVVWENVPGVLSIDGGRAFGAFLGALAEIGYGFAYRILDAQYCGVPQRRRRVFVVGYLGDWRRAAAVLFERESLLGNPAPRREAGEGVAPTISARTKGGGGLGTDFDCDGGLIPSVVGTLTAKGPEAMGAPEVDAGHYIVEQRPADVTHTLRAEGFDASEDGTGRGTPLVPVAFSIMPMNSGKDYKARETDIAQPIMAGGPVGGNQGDDFIVEPVAVYPISADADRANSSALTPSPDAEGRVRLRDLGLGIGAENDPMFTLQATKPPAVAFDLRGREGGAQFEGPHDTANIRSASGGSSRSYVAAMQVVGALATNTGPNGNDAGNFACNQAVDAGHVLPTAMQVRRLTPRECERLQGFPDDYTLVPYRGKPASDGPRYKALGNSMAVPVMAFIGRRIQMVEDLVKGIEGG